MIENRKYDNSSQERSALPETLETSILSANRKFFGRNEGVCCHLDNEESVLYNTVIRYFMGSA